MERMTGKQLKALRLTHGPSLEKFAHKVGVAYATVCRNEQYRHITTEMQKVIDKWKEGKNEGDD